MHFVELRNSAGVRIRVRDKIRFGVNLGQKFANCACTISKLHSINCKLQLHVCNNITHSKGMIQQILCK